MYTYIHIYNTYIESLPSDDVDDVIVIVIVVVVVAVVVTML